jgi:hypothetical protein
MDSKQQSLPQASAPPISRKKRPIRHGVYVNSDDALKVRGGRVTYLVRKAIDQMPSLQQFVPTVRKWAELEVIRQAAFAGIVQTNVLVTDGEDVHVRRLVEDHRKLALAQLVFEKELGLTPMAMAALKGSQAPQLDLVGAMAALNETVVDPGQEGGAPVKAVESKD